MRYLIRFIDFTSSLVGLILLSPFILVIYVLCLFDTKSPLFLQQRVGKRQRTFTLIKFRTMATTTKSLPSHMVSNQAITKLGKYLRHYKLDELPQLINVINGDMSLVGPRPCLPTQEELIRLRDEHGVFDVKPGITGLAQVNNVDMSQPDKLVALEAQMITDFNVGAYLQFIWQTITGKGSGDAAVIKD